MKRRDLLIATTNHGKLREFQILLAGLPLNLRSLAEFPAAPTVEEDATTYLGNATRKALELARWSGLPALADDSGLEVDALGLAPGVHSARYAGPQQDSAANTRKLLAALESVDEARRGARFRCVIVVAMPNGKTCTAEGSCEGRIARTPSGAAGFGYDPVFFSPAHGQTFAELDPAVKNAASHRAVACRALIERLPTFLETNAD